MGPLIATPLRRTESMVACGSGVPAVSMMSTPASWTSQSNDDPEVAAAASRTRRVASASSGPVPSPGISVTRCVRPRAASALVIVVLSFGDFGSRGGYPPLATAREGRHRGDHADRDSERSESEYVDLTTAHHEGARVPWLQQQPEDRAGRESGCHDEHARLRVVQCGDEHTDGDTAEHAQQRVGWASDRLRHGLVPGRCGGGSSPESTATARSAWTARTSTWSVVKPDIDVNGIWALASRVATSARKPPSSHGSGPAKVIRRPPGSTCSAAPPQAGSSKSSSGPTT